MSTIEHWIGGRGRSGALERVGPVWNPATGEHKAPACDMALAHVDHAIRASYSFPHQKL